MDWVRFNGGESPWEPLAIIWDGAPQFVKSELRKLRLDRGVRSRLRGAFAFAEALRHSALTYIGVSFIVKLV